MVRTSDPNPLNSSLTQEEQYRLLVEAITDYAIYMLSPTGIVMSWNPGAQRLKGYPPQEILGKHFSLFYLPEDQAEGKPKRALETASREGRFESEGWRIRLDGSRFWANVVVDPIRAADGTLLGFAKITRGITQQKEGQATLAQARAQLFQSQKMEAVGQLTGGIAHDFNNMLQVVTGSLELMERRIAQGRAEEAGRYVNAVRQAVERATNLTHRMLAFARRQPLHPTAVEPDVLVTGMVELIRRSVGPTIQVDVMLRDGKWSALCDANQLESALLNLALNARDAMPNGGNLLIATADRTVTAADLSHDEEARPGCYVEIAVTDTGAGIASNIKARVFEPFFTTKPTGQGTGLGLSQIYGFVQQSGGFVRLESQPGQGTTVRLFLPRYQQIAADDDAAGDASTDQSAETRAPKAANRQVLVVEDDVGVRAMITEALREEGYTVVEASDGPSGLLTAQSPHRIDLLVTDIGLPGLNGRQLADAARACRPGLPVLLITGYAGTALDDTVLEHDMGLMRKPFPLEDLISRVQTMIEATSA